MASVQAVVASVAVSVDDDKRIIGTKRLDGGICAASSLGGDEQTDDGIRVTGAAKDMDDGIRVSSIPFASMKEGMNTLKKDSCKI